MEWSILVSLTVRIEYSYYINKITLAQASWEFYFPHIRDDKAGSQLLQKPMLLLGLCYTILTVC